MLRLALCLALAGGPALATGLDIEIEGASETVHIDLFEDIAPNHAERMATLAAEGAYDGVAFHRVIDGFMAQTGDVAFGRADGDLSQAGMGGSDLPDLAAEFSDRPFARGTVGMARSTSPDSANSQFFVMFAPEPRLDGEYTVVGEVTEGMEVIDGLTRGAGNSGAVGADADVMSSVTVTD